MTGMPTLEVWRVPQGPEGMHDWPPDGEGVEGCVMHGRILWRSADGTRAVGVWHATPGTIRGTYPADEVFYLTAGRLTVTALADGTEHEVAAGDTMIVTAGVELELRIHEAVTKFWNVYVPGGLPDDVRPRA